MRLPYKKDSGLTTALWVVMGAGHAYLLYSIAAGIFQDADLALIEFKKIRNTIYFGYVLVFVVLGLWHSLKGMGKKKSSQAKHYTLFATLILILVISFALTTFTYQLSVLIAENLIKIRLLIGM